MFTGYLIKLIDEGIIPAVTLAAAKVFGTFLVLWVSKVPWEFSGIGIRYPSLELFVKSNSYSSLLMVAIIFFNLVLWLVRGRYSKVGIWVSYSYLLTIIFATQAYFDLLYIWVAVISFLVSLNLTWFIIARVERETKNKLN